MKRALTSIFITLLITLLISTQFFHVSTIAGQTLNVGYIIRSTVTFYNPPGGNKTWNLTEEDRTINLFLNNTWQTVGIQNSSFPLEPIGVDEDENPIAALQFPRSELKPGEKMNYTTVNLAVSKPRFISDIAEEKSKTLDKIPNYLKERYCSSGGAWLVDDPKLQALAKKIVGNETRVLTIIKGFIGWIKKNINYQFFEDYLYPNETIKELKGACADQAILFITLCRIFGIPAYLQVGCVYTPTRTPSRSDTDWDGHRTVVQNRIGWHAWALAYVPPWGWLPVDLTYSVQSATNPANAIMTGAITSQETILLMNVVQTDLIASARRTMEFLQNNGFHISISDEMNRINLENPRKVSVIWEYLVLGATVTVVLIGSFTYIWKFRKKGKTN